MLSSFRNSVHVFYRSYSEAVFTPDIDSVIVVSMPDSDSVASVSILHSDSEAIVPDRDTAMIVMDEVFE